MKRPRSTNRRLLIAAACIAATQLSLLQLQRQTELEAGRGKKCDVTTLPERLGEWSGTPLEVDARMSAQVGGLTSLDRMYTNREGQRVFVHLATYLTLDISSPHSPELCYSTSGWTTLQSHWWRYQRDQQFRWMTVERDGFRAGLAFWYQVGTHVASNRDELRQVIQTLRWHGRGWPPLVKVLVHVPIELSEEEAKALAEELGNSIYNWVRDNS